MGVGVGQISAGVMITTVFRGWVGGWLGFYLTIILQLFVVGFCLVSTATMLVVILVVAVAFLSEKGRRDQKISGWFWILMR